MIISKLKTWASLIKHNIHALYLASKDSRVPKTAKVIIGIVVAYALSPIDLIPDFIPIIGYLDDLILLPIGIVWAIKLVPPDVWQHCLSVAKQQKLIPPSNRYIIASIIIIWIIALIGFSLWLKRYL